MTRALLDVNVLVALLRGGTGFDDAARRWFHERSAEGWASCTITQAGFVRIAARTIESSGVMPKLMDAIRHMCRSPHHEFWPEGVQMSDIPPEIRANLRGHAQVTDAVLLALAIKRGGRLVTFDRGITALLPSDSPHRSAIEIIPT